MLVIWRTRIETLNKTCLRVRQVSVGKPGWLLTLWWGGWRPRWLKLTMPAAKAGHTIRVEP